jgi:hypothetical protein
MQDSNGIAANQGGALRELSLDEAEMVGGGFSWGGLVHGVEHAAGNVLGAAEAGFGAVAGGGLAAGGGKLAIKLWRAVEHFKLPKPTEGPGPEIPELPPEIFLG